MIKDYEEGELKVMDFDIMNGIIKLKCLQLLINNESSYWFKNSTSCGGIKFLLQCENDL